MVRFAIMGLGYIASRVAQGIQYAKNAQLYAVASRDIKKPTRLKNSFMPRWLMEAIWRC